MEKCVLTLKGGEPGGNLRFFREKIWCLERKRRKIDFFIVIK